ncbi:UDP-N-acetylmuramoyl-L-alanine--D-glutamate ligase [[Limnothrix rosea] IAM M-220]|uniref:UDP-N-acetylmuramoyl-L-alanine--D-glutamate ligase n=1 Tax=[Limnothrix rosea] IAM M-220 TaxID=454133 RepID=UPI0009686185|nr:UDP-N-acetylmuramoyl-L-alanine--D-glutamate ligase [[Limnothrix rosea] IAM M-220]OKH17332.1 UDP-N-acetylmuramoylalanine--D-glutamate ligase [[Limnothrix rosea] IAM M-220]
MGQALVIGVGRSGIAAAKLLKHQGWDVVLGDRQNKPALEQVRDALAPLGITVKLGHNPDLAVDQPDLVVASPGVPWDIPFLQMARQHQVDTIGEMELAWRSLKDIPWVGITGTNGKTTTTALVAAIFKTAGLDAPACGNIGNAACELALREQPPEWAIAEVSSYQIESSQTLQPRIGIWTTFTPDHLARHKTLENYYNIKASLLKRSRRQVLNGNDPFLRSQVDQWPDAYWTSVKGEADLPCDKSKGVVIEDAWVKAFGELIMPVSLLKMVGDHNLQNLLLAIAAARLAGIEKSAITEAIATFPGVPHRLELIRNYQGVQFINDSKATNYDAAEVGLTAVNAPAILIAGGDPKEGDGTQWIKQIKAKAIKALLIGDAAEKFGAMFSEQGFEQYEILETMDQAIARSVELIPELKPKVVLLSPACASFDQYSSFEERGEHFRSLCENLS